MQPPLCCEKYFVLLQGKSQPGYLLPATGAGGKGGIPSFFERNLIVEAGFDGRNFLQSGR